MFDAYMFMLTCLIIYTWCLRGSVPVNLVLNMITTLLPRNLMSLASL